MIKQLLAKGAFVDPVAYCGTPLHIAATEGRDGAMKILLDHGADFDKMVDGETPLDAAKISGKLECVNLLIEGSIVCRHYSNQEVTDMKKKWIQILSSKTAVSCEHCWKDPPTKQQGAGSKERGGKEKKKKKGGGARGATAKEQAKVETSHIWACLVVGSDDYEKIEGHVRFKEMFDIQNYMDQRSLDTEKTIYQLVGIIQHVGTPRGGHYCAYVRAGKMEGQQKQSESSKSWFYASDEVIREACLDECSTDAYQYSANSTGEVLQPRTVAPVVTSPLPPPQVQIKPWEFQRDPNRNKRRSNAMSQEDDIIAQNIGVFLDRLKVYLKETARLFVQKLLTAELNLTDTAREHMQELAIVGSAQCLELKFLEMPKTHKLLKDYLKPPLTKSMVVFGHKGQPIWIPLPNKCALVQRLISDVLSKHRAGFSWEGELTLDDIEIYDDKVVITKIPKSFPIEPQISKEMIVAMEKDFDTIAQTIVKKFQSPMTSIPYFSPFYHMLSHMSQYAEWWSNGIEAEALRELIEHHPFLKPSMTRLNLLSGIFNAFRSYDAGDQAVLFKKILEDTSNSVSWIAKTRRSSNIMVRNVFIRKDQKQRHKQRQMASGPNPATWTATTETIAPAEPNPETGTTTTEATATADPNPGTGTATTEATTTADAAGTKPAIDPTRESRTESVRTADATGTEATTTADATNPNTEVTGYYLEIMGSLIEYLRHLSQHGSERSFDRPFSEQQSHPRKQHMKSLDETEVAGAILLDDEVMHVLTRLLVSSAMIGILCGIATKAATIHFKHKGTTTDGVGINNMVLRHLEVVRNWGAGACPGMFAESVK
uniref:USP domain-containing protein n=1 Tax=Oryza punctata TaxID=4537 RepID=A0A0E0JWW4_ORYPU